MDKALQLIINRLSNVHFCRKLNKIHAVAACFICLFDISSHVMTNLDCLIFYNVIFTVFKSKKIKGVLLKV